MTPETLKLLTAVAWWSFAWSFAWSAVVFAVAYRLGRYRRIL